MTGKPQNKALPLTWVDVGVGAIFGAIVAGIIKIAFPNIQDWAFWVTWSLSFAIFFSFYSHAKIAQRQKNLDETNV